MSNDQDNLKNIVEAALLAAGRPLSLDAMLSLFLDEEQPDRAVLKEALDALVADYAERGIEIREVGTGWRIQVRARYSPWVSRLWEEKPPRYSRALMETLALIAYRQPITRGEIEEIRGVTVSTNIVKTLLEREWVRVVGHRDVPGKPSLYATTRAFLDYFGLKSLDELPTLAEIKDLESLNAELQFGDIAEAKEAAESAEPDMAAEAPSGEGQDADAAETEDPLAGGAAEADAVDGAPEATPEEILDGEDSKTETEAREGEEQAVEEAARADTDAPEEAEADEDEESEESAVTKPDVIH